MKHSRPLFWFLAVPLMLITASAIFLFLLTVQPAKAQCGAAASSCKNCHEVQAKLPVNNDGKPWHQSHAFGDFCVFCHAGNQQATDKVAAHVGLVAPLSDTKAACQQCHAADLDSRVKVYAAILKVTPGAGASAAGSVAPTSAAVPAQVQATAQPTVAATTAPAPTSVAAPALAAAAPQATPCAATISGLAVDDPNTLDYVQHYNEIVLGQRPVNTGNMILVALIGIIAVGGGGFVMFNETKLGKGSTVTKKVEGEYPADVVDMVPAIASLKPESRESLKNILQNPGRSDKVLGALDTLVSDDKTEE